MKRLSFLGGGIFLLLSGIILFSEFGDKHKKNEPTLGAARIVSGEPLASSNLGEPASVAPNRAENRKVELLAPTSLKGTEKLPQTEQQSLWQAFSESRREIRPITHHQRSMPENEGALFVASNQSKTIRARFLANGVRLLSGYRARNWKGVLSLDRGIPLEIRHEGSLIEYDYGELIEWYHNKPEGIQQGWILNERPAGLGEGTRTLSLTLDGLKAEALDGRDVESSDLQLVNEAGEVVMSYGGLMAWDTNGMALDVSMKPIQGGIEILVADAGATYPIVVDPLIASLEGRLAPEVEGGDQDWHDNFGTSVSVSGDRAVIGSPNSDYLFLREVGTAFVFKRSGSTWLPESRLNLQSYTQDGSFGEAVSIDGNTIVVGAPTSGLNGKAYVFTLSGDEWIEEAEFNAPPPAGILAQTFYGYGRSVSIDGDTVLIGEASRSGGRVYAYTRSGSTWSIQQKLLLAAVEPEQDFVAGAFGESVSLDGDTALIGNDTEDNNGISSGVAYVFTRNGSVWSQQDKLTAGDPADDDYFGGSVSLDGDTALIGAYGNDDNGSRSGSAYVFNRSGSTWTQQAKLLPADGNSDDLFGAAVSLDGDTAVATSYGKGSGATYVFIRSGNVWTQQQKLVAAGGSTGDEFGNSVSIDGGTILIGSHKDHAPDPDSGSAYVFTYPGSGWTQQAKLTAIPLAGNDEFGESVSLSGNTAIIGDPFDEDNGSSAGSAYVFTRSGITWTQQAKLLANDGAALDFFGTSVSIDADTAVIGAYGVDDSGSKSGSAYVFTRSGSTWTQQAELLAADGAEGDNFGAAVSNDGDTVLVGANAFWEGDRIGSAYAFIRDGFTWTQQAKFTPGSSATEQFGKAVSIDEDTALIGAPNANKVYAFTRNGTTWNLQQVLLATNGGSSDSFGISASIDGDTAIVGAFSNDDKATNAGAAYIFTRSADTWSQQQKLTASNGISNDYFGTSVSLQGGVAVVGAPRRDLDFSGQAYVYVFNGNTWNQEVILERDGISAGNWSTDYFGQSVSIDGDSILISSTRAAEALSVWGTKRFGSGGAYVYRGLDFPPTDITLSSGKVNGGEPVGTMVGLIGAADPDPQETFTFSLVNGDGDTDNSSFTVGGGNGNELLTADVLLHATQTTYSIRLQVEDSRGRTFQKVFTITLNAIPEDIGLNNTSVVENAPVDTVVGTLSATDNDPGDTFSYSLVSGTGDTDNTLFSIGGLVNDEVLTATVFDQETKASCSIRLQVEDSTGNTYEKVFVISVLDDRTEDTDGDGYTEAEEEDIFGTSDLLVDSDGDNFTDAEEIKSGTDPSDVNDEPVFAQLAKVISSDAASSDYFGYAVCLSRDLAVMGAIRDDDAATSSGSAYIFRKQGAVWIQEAKLTADDGAGDDRFGTAVAIDEDTAVVGSPNADGGGSNRGAVYIYVFDGSSWIQQQKITAFDAADLDYFGSTLGISGNSIIVGVSSDGDNGSLSGSAYIYTRTNDVWTLEQKLTGFSSAGDRFGSAVAIDQDVVMVGAESDDNFGNNEGAVHFFERSEGTWSPVQSMGVNGGNAGDGLGVSVDLSGNVAVAGATGDDEGDRNTGSAYIFTRTNGSWSETTRLNASDASRDDSFGNSVSISGDNVVVGASSVDDDIIGKNVGKAYVFKLDQGAWTEKYPISSNDPSANAFLGYSVSIDGTTVLAGAYRAKDDESVSTGAGYLFGLTYGSRDGDGVSNLWQVLNGFDPDIDDVHTLDSDGDGDTDIWEIFQGTDRNAVSQQYRFQQVSATETSLTTQFRRSTTQTAVNPNGKWSTDMTNWFKPDETHNGVTISFAEEISDSGIDYEIVTVTLTKDSGNSSKLFYSIELTPVGP